MRGRPFLPGSLLEPAALRCHIGLNADNRFDAHLGCGLIKIDSAENIPVVGHAEGGHFAVSGFLDEIFDAAGPIEEAVLRVDVQMNEIGRTHNKKSGKVISGRVVK